MSNYSIIFHTPKVVSKTFAAKPFGYLIAIYCIQITQGRLQTSRQVTTPLVNLAVDFLVLCNFADVVPVFCLRLYSNTPYIIIVESIGSEKHIVNAIP